MPAKTLGRSSVAWGNSGTGGPTAFSTGSTAECLSVDAECSSLPSTLEQILAPTAPQRFFLSARAATGILRRAGRRGRDLPMALSRHWRRCRSITAGTHGFPDGVQEFQQGHFRVVPEQSVHGRSGHQHYAEGIGNLTARDGKDQSHLVVGPALRASGGGYPVGANLARPAGSSSDPSAPADMATQASDATTTMTDSSSAPSSERAGSPSMPMEPPTTSSRCRTRQHPTRQLRRRHRHLRRRQSDA